MFDCSELVQWSAGQVGIEMPDGSWLQYLELKDQLAHYLDDPYAPVVERAGAAVEVLASVRLAGVERPVVCRQGHVVVAAFPPELSGDGRLHELALSPLRRPVADPTAPTGERLVAR